MKRKTIVNGIIKLAPNRLSSTILLNPGAYKLPKFSGWGYLIIYEVLILAPI